jgi:hypothetical protein
VDLLAGGRRQWRIFESLIRDISPSPFLESREDDDSVPGMESTADNIGKAAVMVAIEKLG